MVRNCGAGICGDRFWKASGGAGRGRGSGGDILWQAGGALRVNEVVGLAVR